MTHEPIPQPDGFSEPPSLHVHATPYERELDALRDQLIRTASVRYLGHARPNPLPSSVENFRVLAGIAVVLADSGRCHTIKLQLAEELSEDYSKAYDVAGLIRHALDEYEARLAVAGKAAQS